MHNICLRTNQNRGRTIQLDKLKNRIYREIENTDAEEKSLAEYRREMEMLLQEKMSHVEELRQIHADINAVSAQSLSVSVSLTRFCTE